MGHNLEILDFSRFDFNPLINFGSFILAISAFSGIHKLSIKIRAGKKESHYKVKNMARLSGSEQLQYLKGGIICFLGSVPGIVFGSKVFFGLTCLSGLISTIRNYNKLKIEEDAIFYENGIVYRGRFIPWAITTILYENDEVIEMRIGEGEVIQIIKESLMEDGNNDV